MISLQALPALKNGENCYLLSLSSGGELRIAAAAVRETGAVARGINRARIVTCDGKTGYQKNSGYTDSSDDPEMVINWVGRFLHINMAQTYRMLAPDGTPAALVSKSVVQTDDSDFISMREMRRRAAGIMEQLNHDGWADRYLRLLDQMAYPDVPEAFEPIAQTPEELSDVIEMGYRVIGAFCGSQAAQIAADYENMLFLDALTGQVDRTVDNYGFIYQKQTGTYAFAPLFDNATLRKPYTGNHVCMINHFLTDRALAVRCLMQIPGIRSKADDLLARKGTFVRELIRISDLFLAPEQYDLLLSNILLGLWLMENR